MQTNKELNPKSKYFLQTQEMSYEFLLDILKVIVYYYCDSNNYDLCIGFKEGQLRIFWNEILQMTKVFFYPDLKNKNNYIEIV